MRRWAFMLGGLVVWAAHFAGVYLIASIADVAAEAAAPASRIAVGLFTALCAGANGLILFHAVRIGRGEADAVDRFVASLAGIAAGVSLVAVLWQGLPAVVGH